jgi:hypothetical protein
MVLPLGPRRQQSHLRIPLVRSSTTQNRLAPRMVGSLPTPHNIPHTRRSQSAVHPTHQKYTTHQENPTNIYGKNHHWSSNRLGSPRSTETICTVYQSLQRRRIPQLPTNMHLGPRNRVKTRCPRHHTQENILTIADRTRRNPQVHQRTPEVRNHLTIKRTICSPFLLHQEERQQTTPSTRLPKTQRMDYLQPLTITPYPPTHRQTKRVHPLHQIQHMLGIQQCQNQGRRPVEGSLYHK